MTDADPEPETTSSSVEDDGAPGGDLPGLPVQLTIIAFLVLAILGFDLYWPFIQRGVSDLFAAWSVWSSGFKVNDHVKIWGWSILAWGRIGKLMQLIAALVIIIEIVGPARLRTFGNSLRWVDDPIRHLRRLAAKTLHWAKAWIMYWLAIMLPMRKISDRLYANAWDLQFRNYSITAMVLGLVGAVPLAVRLFHAMDKTNLFDWIFGVVYLLGGWIILTGVVLPIAILAFFSLSNVVSYAINWLFINPVARVLETQNLTRTAQIVSVIVLLLGFQFDLLAS